MPSDDVGGPMSETRFSAEDAAQALVQAQGWEEALRQRTEGITVATWGLVSPGIFLSYALAGASFGDDVPAWGSVLFALLWAPWVAAGVAVTASLWRSACLAAPQLDREQPNGLVITLAWLGAYTIFGGAAWFLGPRMNEPTYALLAVGAAWTVFGALNLYRCSPVGRRVGTGVGLCVFVSGLVLAFTLPAEPIAGYVYATVFASLTSSVFPLAGGLWQASRA